jgi:hypothetical protein
MSRAIHSTRNDVTAKQSAIGGGVPCRWMCLHCGLVRPMAGAVGVGIRKRCAECARKEQP